jgi:hypothetical protein
MRLALVSVLGIAACGAGPEEIAFGFAGEVRDNPPPGSVISLWTVATGEGAPYLYKFGDGSTAATQFDMTYRSDPPFQAVNADGIGIARMGLLRGIATLRDGKTTLAELVLEGLSGEHAVVWKGPGATGPAWATAFPEGFTCARCIRGGAQGLDTLEPVDCTFMLIRGNTATSCTYY